MRAHDDVLEHLRRAREAIDTRFAEPLPLESLAGIAGLSRAHFQRLFTATYGQSPQRYLTGRRIERAQDLLRTSNLTVTEVCVAVGYSSLGTFSRRFAEIVGEAPSAFQARYARDGAPRIPGCYVFMWGLAERANQTARSEKPPVVDAE